MVEILIKVKHQGNRQLFYDGDLLVAKDDGFVWGRYEDKRRWVREGQGHEDHDEDRRHQTAQNWPGGLAILKVRGISVDGLFELFEPHRDGERRLMMQFDTSGLDFSEGGLQMGRDVFLSRIRKKK